MFLFFLFDATDIRGCSQKIEGYSLERPGPTPRLPQTFSLELGPLADVSSSSSSRTERLCSQTDSGQRGKGGEESDR